MIFTNVIKPTHICNLACKYCYNDDVRDPVMKIDTLDRVISETFSYMSEYEKEGMTSFIWHGGEPMVARQEFFEAAVKFQRKYSKGIAYENSIQTNGTLINSAWIDFLKKNDFTVSISLDGTKTLHDKNRIDHAGRGSFEKVVQSIKKVQDAEIPLGVCIVISSDNKNYADELYNVVAELQVPFNVIPMNKSGGARDSYKDVGLEAEEYADTWIKMYDRWFDEDEGYVYCSDFVFKTRAILTSQPVDCIGLKSCASNNISIDPVGDVFPCATLSGSTDTFYGNINEESLHQLLASERAAEYKNREVDEQCSTCKWQHVCHGGCHARAYKFYGNHNRRDYYCPSLFKIYEHIENKLIERVPDAYRKNDASRSVQVVEINQKEIRS